MEDRIRKFMEYKGISPSELADSIGVQRSNVTHVLKARNKPSFQFIEKMLQIYPELDAKWLMLGTGNMVDTPVKTKTLFDQITETESPSAKKTETTEQKPFLNEPMPVEPKELTIPPVSENNEKKIAGDELQDQFFSSEKPIERLVVFYKDSTFKVYNPSR
ncbi:MAG TPA: helix-turn-helix transcriptional regulator [Prolixibacteraceae bacterium]|nr:helix-turn-helix transcriptional regulator [Prolixibacteraceae bacterium]